MGLFVGLIVCLFLCLVGCVSMNLFDCLVVSLSVCVCSFVCVRVSCVWLPHCRCVRLLGRFFAYLLV